MDHAAHARRRARRTTAAVALVALLGLGAAALLPLVRRGGTTLQDPGATPLPQRTAGAPQLFPEPTPLDPQSPPYPPPYTNAPSDPASPLDLAPGPVAMPEQALVADLPPSPLGQRREVSVTWTGEELVVMGGFNDPVAHGNQDRHFDGARYDPDARTWRAIPAPPVRLTHLLLHAAEGQLMAVGWNDFGPFQGAVFDLDGEQWRALPPLPSDAGDATVAGWSGSSLVVFDGSRGAVFDVAEDRWRGIAAPPRSTEIFPGGTREGVQVDGEIVFEGGLPGPENDPWAYDPQADSWREFPLPEGAWQLLPTQGAGVFTYGEALTEEAPGAPLRSEVRGWLYRDGTWQDLGVLGMPDRLFPFWTAWTGERLVIVPWDYGRPFYSVAPDTGRWTVLPTMLQEMNDDLVWTGDRILSAGFVYREWRLP